MKKVSAKLPTGKWWVFGSLKVNQYGNEQLSFKNTPEFKKFVNEGGEWLNFSLFEDKPKEVTEEASRGIEELKRKAIEDQEIPF